MQLTNRQIAEFKETYKRALGIQLSDAHAREVALEVVDFIRALIDPIDSDRDARFIEDFTRAPIRRKVRKSRMNGGDG